MRFKEFSYVSPLHAYQCSFREPVVTDNEESAASGRFVAAAPADPLGIETFRHSPPLVGLIMR
jgi:hypothetical protein